jgi:hypothetical protein
MPDTSSAGQITRQRQAHALLGRLLELAAEDGLPAITWAVTVTGAGLGGHTYADPHALRRDQFATWKAALTRVAGRGPDRDRETALASGETRLTAHWEDMPVRAGGRYPTVRVSIAASIWPDDEDED